MMALSRSTIKFPPVCSTNRSTWSSAPTQSLFCLLGTRTFCAAHGKVIEIGHDTDRSPVGSDRTGSSTRTQRHMDCSCVRFSLGRPMARSKSARLSHPCVLMRRDVIDAEHVRHYQSRAAHLHLQRFFRMVHSVKKHLNVLDTFRHRRNVAPSLR